MAVFAVWTASYVSTESLECEGNISSSSFYGQLTDYFSLIFNFIHPVDEFSFKEMRTWYQSKISSCYLCVEILIRSYMIINPVLGKTTQQIQEK